MKVDCRPCEPPDHDALLSAWRDHLVSRRRFLLAMAGGSVAALFPATAISVESPAGRGAHAQWLILDHVLQHLLPSEADSPGAREIDALGYFRFIVDDDSIDEDEREFILQGSLWLEDMSLDMMKSSFTALDEARRERVLRRIEQSDAGHNWLSTLLLYLFEALLADPVYGGNTNGAGWQWLQHTPGFPRPPADKRYPDLLKL